MKLSTIACGLGLLGVLTHCGSGTGGSAGSTNLGQGDPGGPYAGSGNSGPLEQGQNPSNPFGRFVSAGPNSGQGSAGPYSDPGHLWSVRTHGSRPRLRSLLREAGHGSVCSDEPEQSPTR